MLKKRKIGMLFMCHNASNSFNFTKILPRSADFFEQKETKKTKEEFFFFAFVCFCGNWACLEKTDSKNELYN